MQLIKLILFVFLISFAKQSLAQNFASTFKPKSQTDKLVLAKVKALPEIKEWYQTAKKSNPDMEIDQPGQSSKYYNIQVGIDNMGMFRTNYHLRVDPKTLKIYYADLMDESGMKLITLELWRQWRSKPGFFKMHTWKNGKLVVLKN